MPDEHLLHPKIALEGAHQPLQSSTSLRILKLGVSPPRGKSLGKVSTRLEEALDELPQHRVRQKRP